MKMRQYVAHCSLEGDVSSHTTLGTALHCKLEGETSGNSTLRIASNRLRSIFLPDVWAFKCTPLPQNIR